MTSSARDLRSRIVARGMEASVVVPPPLAESLAAYLELLARWNRKINLTSFQLEPAGDEALDRLIVEPLAARRCVRPDDELVIDVGSGGGSPALPLKLAEPRLRMVLVESKIRKTAFLREAIRQLGLVNIAVESRRLEDLRDREDLRSADVVTVRAVRLDARTLRTISHFVGDRGRLLALGLGAGQVFRSPGMASITTVPLVPALRSQLTIVEFASI